MVDQVLIHLRLVGDEARALKDLAASEMRHPRDQLRFLLRQELERRQLLNGEPFKDEEEWDTTN